MQIKLHLIYLLEKNFQINLRIVFLLIESSFDPNHLPLKINFISWNYVTRYAKNTHADRNCYQMNGKEDQNG